MSSLPGLTGCHGRRALCSAAVSLFLWAGVPAVGGAQSPATIAIGSATIGQGLTGAVTVSIRGVDALYGADVQLAFDPTALEVQDVNPNRDGVQIALGTFLSPDMVVRDVADNAAGMVHVAFTQISPAEPRSGSGELFTVIFKALRAGEATQVRVHEAVLADRNGMAINAGSTPGRVTLVGSQQAPATPTAAPLVEPTLVVEPAQSRGNNPRPTSAPSNPGGQPPASGAPSLPTPIPGAGRGPTGSGATTRAPGPATVAAGGPETGVGESSSHGDAQEPVGTAADDDAGDALAGAATPEGEAVAELVGGSDGMGAAGEPPSAGDGATTSGIGGADGDSATNDGLWIWLVLIAVLLVVGITVFTRRT